MNRVLKSENWIWKKLSLQAENTWYVLPVRQKSRFLSLTPDFPLFNKSFLHTLHAKPLPAFTGLGLCNQGRKYCYLRTCVWIQTKINLSPFLLQNSSFSHVQEQIFTSNWNIPPVVWEILHLTFNWHLNPRQRMQMALGGGWRHGCRGYRRPRGDTADREIPQRRLSSARQYQGPQLAEPRVPAVIVPRLATSTRGKKENGRGHGVTPLQPRQTNGVYNPCDWD